MDRELKGRTRLFVTNQLQYLHRCDKVIFIKNGAILGHGQYEEVRKNCPDLDRMMRGTFPL